MPGRPRHRNHSPIEVSALPGLGPFLLAARRCEIGHSERYASNHTSEALSPIGVGYWPVLTPSDLI